MVGVNIGFDSVILGADYFFKQRAVSLMIHCHQGQSAYI
jgi:hypothetical protein